MRWVVVSLVVHVMLLAWFAALRGDEHLVAWQMPTLPAVAHADAETIVELLDEPSHDGGGGGGASNEGKRSARTSIASTRSSDAWEQIDVSVESTVGDGVTGDGGGTGGGTGGGHGTGIGLGTGAGLHADDVPAPPPPPPVKVSKARPAKLVWPTRDEEVDDDASLFTAKITVDEDGDVVAARMLTLRIGAKADRAASAIWTFRYSPALDDGGRPIRSTLEQSFQVR